MGFFSSSCSSNADVFLPTCRLRNGGLTLQLYSTSSGRMVGWCLKHEVPKPTRIWPGQLHSLLQPLDIFQRPDKDQLNSQNGFRHNIRCAPYVNQSLPLRLRNFL